MAKREKQLTKLEALRKKIDESLERGDEQSAIEYKKQAHAVYKGRRIKKIAVWSAVIAILLAAATVAIVDFVGYRNTLEARGNRIQKNFEGLVFAGERTTDDGYAEAVGSGTLDKKKTYFKVYEHVTLSFDTRGNIKQHSIHDKKVLSYDESKLKPKDYYNESDTTYYTFEVFVNLKGGVFVHIRDKLYKLVLDENDMPLQILGFNGKTLYLK